MKKLHPKTSAPHRGFTLIEALLLVVILGISGAAIGRSLRDIAKSPEQNNIALATETSILDKMEFLRSVPFATLANDANKPTSVYTDTATVEGAQMTRTVAIVYLDPTTGLLSGTATNLAGKPNMLQITVSIGNKTVYNLVNQP
jgi:type II secretory pathway pseudopilin PulG